MWKIKLAIDEEKADELKIGKVNVDEQMELAMRFQVSSIPMVVLFKDGKPVAKSVGFCSKARICGCIMLSAQIAALLHLSLAIICGKINSAL